MTDTTYDAADFKSLEAQSNRHLARLGLAAVLALSTGLIAQDNMPGSIIAIIPLALMVVMFARQFKLGWSSKVLFATLVNVLALIAVIIEPGFMNLAVIWFALAAFALLQQGAALPNIYDLLRAALTKLFTVPMQLLRDVETLKAVRLHLQTHKHILTFANLLLPVAAVVMFGALLMQANPIIEALIYQISWGNPSHFLASWGLPVSVATFGLIWSVLRMRFKPEDHIIPPPLKIWAEGFLANSTVTITLLLLNGMFFIENAFDYKYVWLGQALPHGMNYAEYVHRGAYALIATAILAGALVTFILQPGAAAEKSRILRWLVYAWVIQNLMLVFSSALRTLAYIDAYAMTQWRLAGLVWMGVVAAGLTWIILRIVLKRGHLWLVNANLHSTFVLLLICGFIDFNGIVADWNVERALKAPIVHESIDVGYLLELGPSALPALQILKGQNQVSAIQLYQTNHLKLMLNNKQANWQSWTLRGTWLQNMLNPEPI